MTDASEAVREAAAEVWGIIGGSWPAGTVERVEAVITQVVEQRETDKWCGLRRELDIAQQRADRLEAEMDEAHEDTLKVDAALRTARAQLAQRERVVEAAKEWSRQIERTPQTPGSALDKHVAVQLAAEDAFWSALRGETGDGDERD